MESHLGNIEQARQHYDAALPLFEAEQDRLGTANTLQSLGDLESRLGNIEQARQHYDAALPLFEAEQDRLGTANTLRSLGDLESRLGNIEQARQHYVTAQQLFEQEHDPMGRMNSMISLARLEAAEGHLEQARLLFQNVFRLAEQIGFSDHPVTQNLRQEYAQLEQGQRILQNTPDIVKALIDQLTAWIQAPDWDQSKTYLQEYADSLLSDDAEAVLTLMQQRNPNNPAIPQHQRLLKHCRELGIPDAYQEIHTALAAAKKAAQDPTKQALQTLLQVNSSKALEQALTQHPVLLEIPTIELLTTMVIDAPDEQTEAVQHLLTLLTILLERYNRAHQEQIDLSEQAAFIALHEELLPIAESLNADLLAGLLQSLSWALNTLGNAYAAQENHVTATETYTRALSHTPNDAVLYRNRASEYLELDQLEQAQADIEAAATLEPEAERLPQLKKALNEKMSDES